MEYNIYTQTCDVPEQVNFKIATKKKKIKKPKLQNSPPNLRLLSN